MNAQPMPLRAALDRARSGADDERLADDRRAVLREYVDRALGEHAHKATITVDEFAQIIGVSRSSAFDAVRRGEVPALRLGRRVAIPLPALVSAMLLGVTPNGVSDGAHDEAPAKVPELRNTDHGASRDLAEE